jgi:hypothetical protein
MLNLWMSGNGKITQDFKLGELKKCEKKETHTNVCTYPIIIQCVMHGAFSAHILDITCKYKYISSGILVQNAYRYKKKNILLLILHPLIYSFLPMPVMFVNGSGRNEQSL